MVPTDLRARMGIGLFVPQLRRRDHDYRSGQNLKQTTMTEPGKAFEIQLRAVRRWLLAAAAMIFLTLIVGGATRLTECGLSIVEWKPITGVLPPLSENQWRTEF